MKSFIKRVFSAMMAVAVIISFSSLTVQSGAKTMTGIKIVTLPTKTTFYKGTDWDYGIWEASGEEADIDWTWVHRDNKISFLYNGGNGQFPERGMLDMRGMVVELSYSDGSKRTVSYSESKNSSGRYTANILFSPVSGDFKVGENKVYVYVKENPTPDDVYTINITTAGASRVKGDVNNDGAINSTDALIVLQFAVGSVTLSSEQKKYADMNSDGKYNSSDALLILNKAVGK